MRELQTVYDDIDQTNPADRMRAAAPAFFVDTMKKYISRNSIKISAPEFVMYCACTWDAQKHWLTADNIGWAIQVIISELQYPRLPADTDWNKPYMEWASEKRREQLDMEREKKIHLISSQKTPKPTPEQIARVEHLIRETTEKLAANAN